MIALVLVEHEGGQLKDATLATVTAASKLGEVHALVAGQGVGGVAEEAARLAGVTKVHIADDAAYAHGLAENVAPLVAQVMQHCDYFLAPATTTGKNIAPRVAALLDVMQISDILSVEGPDTFTRPIYAGNAIATVQSSDSKKVITVRGTAFEKAAREGGSAEIEAVSGGGEQGLSSFVGQEVAHSERPELTSATIVVSGGRAWAPRAVPRPHRSARRQARRRGRARAARRGRGLCAERLPGRPDRQDRRAGRLYRGRHFRARSSTLPA
jgi:electron transfer flavoprotein alpha subunit